MRHGLQTLFSLRILLGLLTVAAFCGRSLYYASAASVVIASGEKDRLNTPIIFELPSGWPRSGSLSSDDGSEIHYAAGPDGRGQAILPRLAKQTRKTFRLKSDPTRNRIPGTMVKSVLEADNKGIQFLIGTNRVIRYQGMPGSFPRPNINIRHKRGAYIHPIWTPSGVVVTDDFPTNHIHHHGIWAAWTHTEFDARKPDFWNLADGKGRVDFDKILSRWDGPVSAGLRARHVYRDLTTQPTVEVLEEIWTMTLWAIESSTRPLWIFDLESEQSLLTNIELKLPEYRYGGTGFRGHELWNGKGNWTVLTSNGTTDRERAHGERADWCYVGGVLGGSLRGIVVMGHPTNFRSPQPMRVHPTEPFLNFAPQQAGNMSIQPGQKYVSKYRYVVFDGNPDIELIRSLWSDYAYPIQTLINP